MTVDRSNRRNISMPVAAAALLSLHPHLCKTHTSCSSSSITDPQRFPKQCKASNFHTTDPITSLSSFKTTASNPEFPASLELLSLSNNAVKMATPPWLKGPLFLQPHEILNPLKPNSKDKHNEAGNDNRDKALTKKESGVRGKKAMKKILESIEKLQLGRNSNETQKVSDEVGVKLSLERKFSEEEKEGVENSSLKGRRNMPWDRNERIVFRRTKKEKVVTAAELTLDQEFLQRLRSEASRMRQWVKVKKAGVTEEVVRQIKLAWRRNELAMVKFDIPLCRNMDRAHEVLEMKTGGLVVWRKKDTLVIYRGSNYRKAPYFRSNQAKTGSDKGLAMVKFNARSTDKMLPVKLCEMRPISSVSYGEGQMSCEQVRGSLYEREGDRLLNGLGPRFVDWWMHKPLPVDADLLPELVPGFRSPFRRSPPRTRAKLTDYELTYLRKLAHPLPTHFVLGRNRGLQGLAAAIIKLWEKSLIAKITVKFGVPNTNNERMAEELKRLTGGVLLLRNKFIIILFRGKDFIPSRLANLIQKREVELKSCQIHEEVSRLKAVQDFSVGSESLPNTSMSGTLSEYLAIQTKLQTIIKENKELDISLNAEKQRLERQLRWEERRALILNKKIERSEEVLVKLDAAWASADKDTDPELITEEERECLRKIGLKMDPYLVLGRRGVFDGVLEGLHQHWKYREITRVITKQRTLTEVMHTANLLELESGGVLLSVDQVKGGHAIIIYRGKNYRRPVKPVAKKLLTKREALRRSIEMQRIGSLKSFTQRRQQRISNIKLKLAGLKEHSKNNQPETEEK